MVYKRLWRTKTQWDFSATQSDSGLCQRSNEGHVLTIQAWQVQDYLTLSWDGESDDKQDTKERKGIWEQSLAVLALCVRNWPEVNSLQVSKIIIWLNNHKSMLKSLWLCNP